MEEQVTERMVIRASPAHCFQVLTDFERYPEWASDIKAVVVNERDAEGRPAQVTFRAAALEGAPRTRCVTTTAPPLRGFPGSRLKETSSAGSMGATTSTRATTARPTSHTTLWST